MLYFIWIAQADVIIRMRIRLGFVIRLYILTNVESVSNVITVITITYGCLV